MMRGESEDEQLGQEYEDMGATHQGPSLHYAPCPATLVFPACTRTLCQAMVHRRGGHSPDYLRLPLLHVSLYLGRITCPSLDHQIRYRFIQAEDRQHKSG